MLNAELTSSYCNVVEVCIAAHTKLSGAYRDVFVLQVSGEGSSHSVFVFCSVGVVFVT